MDNATDLLIRTSYLPGVPCMVDTEQPDPNAAAEFYGGVFGWEFDDKMPPGSGEHYLVASLHGHSVAAIASPAPGGANPAAWNTYVSVADADAAIQRANELGAEIVVAPVDVGPPGSIAGRWAAIVDPDGAALRLWQPGYRHGVEIVNAPGSWNSSDLSTSNPTGASAFYGSLFGWETMTMEFAGDESIIWRLKGYGDVLAAADPDVYQRLEEMNTPAEFADAIGWLVPTSDDDATAGQAATTSARWTVTFGVADTDATVERAVQLGGSVVVAPMDSAGGIVRTATIRDPQGAELIVGSFDPTAGTGDW